jgi:hypothetical protein
VRRDLVLGYIHGYQWETIAPFVNSLRDSGFSGEICLFASGIDGETKTTIQTKGVRVLDSPFQQSSFRKWMVKRWGVLKTTPFPIRRRILKSILGINMLRHFLYEEYLSRHGENYRHVLLSDVRDVIFQDNPFTNIASGGVHFFEEAVGRTIASEPYNSSWMRTLFGERVFSEFAEKPILCSGTILGESRALAAFLSHNIRILVAASGFESYGDQAIVNVAVRRYKNNEIYIHKNGESTVLTMGIMPLSDICFDDRGRIVGPDGRVIPVLHQYDRHPSIYRKAAVLQKWLCQN